MTLDDFLSSFDDPEIQKFREWCKDRNFTSILWAIDLYQATTGIRLDYRKFAPF